MHKEVPSAHTSLLLKIIRSHLSQSLRTHCRLEMVVAYPEKAELNYLGEKTIVSDLTRPWSEEFDDHCCNNPNHCCPHFAVLSGRCCENLLIFEATASEISPQPLVHITSPVPSRLPIHSLSVKPQCSTKNDVPGEAKASLSFTGALSTMAGSKPFLKG